MKVLAALSGGVDSAVAAARAVEGGHDVVGVHLALSPDPKAFREGARGCCSLEDARDARRVADVLGIPFYVWDLSEQFKAEVIDDFVAEYAAGRTPNPCLRCNEHIKFAAVLDRAVDLGFDAVATGHYARLANGPAGVELHRAADPAKDQSYVLSVLEPAQLERSMFPLGDDHKEAVRAEALHRGLLVAEKPDSHDICFVADGRTGDFLTARLGQQQGAIRDAETGEQLGSHDGAHAFTIGQRRGLRLERPRDDGAARYVVGIDAPTRTILVGPEQMLSVDLVSGSRPRWCGPVPASGTPVGVQVRAHGRETPAVMRFDGQEGLGGGPGEVSLELAQPERGVAAGQTAALYSGTRVVGSCTITSAARAATSWA